MENRKLLEENLSNVFAYLRKDRKNVEMFKDYLINYNIPNGDVQQVVSGVKSLNEIDPRELCLYTLKSYELSDDERINPGKFFTVNETNEARTGYSRPDKEYLKLPITIYNVLEIEPNKQYSTFMDIKTIEKWIEGKLLNYNQDTQREATRKQVGDEIISTPTIHESSVREIEKHLLEGTLTPTTLTFNIRPGSANEGDDMVYNRKEHSLTLNEGITADVIDGFHRIIGSLRALAKKDIDFTFEVSIRSYTMRTAQRHIGQVANTNSFDPSHQKAMEQARQSDWIVSELIGLSELRGRVSTASRPSKGELVSFATLSDIIDEIYKPSTKKEAIPVLEYLIDFFDRLLVSFDEFEGDSDSLIKENSMFNGFVIVSKYMKDNNIPLSRLKQVLTRVDFSRNNHDWVQYGIIDEKGRIGSSAKRKVKDYFSMLIKEGVLHV